MRTNSPTREKTDRAIMHHGFVPSQWSSSQPRPRKISRTPANSMPRAAPSPKVVTPALRAGLAQRGTRDCTGSGLAGGMVKEILSFARRSGAGSASELVNDFPIYAIGGGHRNPL